MRYLPTGVYGQTSEWEMADYKIKIVNKEVQMWIPTDFK